MQTNLQQYFDLRKLFTRFVGNNFIMGDWNIGPPSGCWTAGIILAIIGLLSGLYWIVKGIIWLINHITIT